MVRQARYDEPRARALVPLLRAITHEMQEREQEIDRLEQRLLALRRQESSRNDGPAALLVQAQLATQCAERRRSQKELDALGCVLDEDHALRVLIPGTDGKFVHGYAWSPFDGVVTVPTS